MCQIRHQLLMLPLLSRGCLCSCLQLRALLCSGLELLLQLLGLAVRLLQSKQHSKLKNGTIASA